MKIPEGLPEHLHSEYLKMIENEGKYKRMYPVAYDILIKYIKDSNGKEKDKHKPD